MLLQLFLDNAARDPDGNALVYGERRWSWQAVCDRVLRLAGGLAAAGIGPGDRVALWLDNTPGFIFSLFAALARGGVVAPLNPALKRGDFQLLDHPFDAVISSEGVAAACRRAMAPQRLLLLPEGDDAPCALFDHDPLAPVACAAQAPALLQFSSGTTGRPKGLYRSHGQCLAEIRHLRAACGITAADRIFCALPLHHAHGLGNALWAAVGSGAALILMARPQPFTLRWPEALELLAQERATLFPGVPLMFEALAQAPGQGDLGSLRLCFSAGSALPERTHGAFLARYGIAVRQLYGCTEAGSLCLDLDAQAAPATVGRPLPGVEVAIRDGDTPLPPGETGEVFVRSPAATTAYLGEAALSRQSFRGGWFATGDMGHLDGEGRLRIAGRQGLMLEVAGHKVYPEEVEAVLASHPKILDCAVAGVHIEQPLPRLKAFVVAREPLAEEEFFRFCRAHLAAHKRPSQVAFVAALPKTALGKTARERLH